jgi:hypothetical protein
VINFKIKIFIDFDMYKNGCLAADGLFEKAL